MVSGRSLWLRRLPLVVALGVVLMGAVPPDEARREELAALEAYLNGLSSLQSSFVQIAPNGATSSGQLYYERPDKMRMNYDPPSLIEIIANGRQVVYHDRRLKQVSHLFTSRTPLAFLLQDEIRLQGKVTVTGLERAADEVRVTLVQTEEPREGRITLVFGDEPVELRRWSVTDPQGLTTHIVLEDVETDVPIDDKLFSFRNPYRYRSPGD